MPAQESRLAQRFTISTTDEAEAEAFIRQTYTGNRTQFHRAAGDAQFTVTAAYRQRFGVLPSRTLRS